MKTETQTQHTQGEWKIISTHPVLENTAIVVGSGRNESKNIEKYKVICEFPNWRGDAFVRLEDGEAEANAQRIVKAVNMHDESIRLIKNSLIELQALGGDKDTRQLILKLIDFINDNNV